MAIAKKATAIYFISTTSGYPWQVALQQSPLAFGLIGGR
jgi:hypothetical protein